MYPVLLGLHLEQRLAGLILLAEVWSGKVVWSIAGCEASSSVGCNAAGNWQDKGGGCEGVE